MPPIKPKVGTTITVVIAAMLLVAPAVANQPPVESAPLVAPSDGFAKVHDSAVMALKAGRFEEALAAFDRAIEINSRVPLAYYNRGNVRIALKDLKGAVADYAEAIKLKPDFALAYMNRGSALSSLERMDDAIKDLDEAVRLDPASSDALLNRAIVRLKGADLKGATDDYLKMLNLDRSVSDDRAEKRLQALMEAAEGQEGRTYELSHGRLTESVLTLLQRSCLTAGQDQAKMSLIAKREGWKPIQPSQLRSEANREALGAAWSFRALDTMFYVVQSKAEGNSACSVSMKPLDDHLLIDLKRSLMDRHKMVHTGDTYSPKRFESNFSLTTEQLPDPIDLQIIDRPSARFVTLRVVYPSSQ